MFSLDTFITGLCSTQREVYITDYIIKSLSQKKAIATKTSAVVFASVKNRNFTAILIIRHKCRQETMDTFAITENLT